MNMHSYIKVSTILLDMMTIEKYEEPELSASPSLKFIETFADVITIGA